MDVPPEPREDDSGARELARKSGVRFRLNKRPDGLWLASLNWTRDNVVVTMLGQSAQDACLKLMYACEELDE